MFKGLTSLIFGLTLLFTNTSATAIMIGDVDVGDPDELKARDTLSNSGEATELNWVRDNLGYDISLSSKTNCDGDACSFISDGTNYAFNLLSEPSHFLIKVGNGGNKVTDSHFLYENKDSLSWAVFQLSDFAAEGSTIDIFRVSHIGEYGGSIPEPAVTALIGIGLLGITVVGGIRRRLI